MAGVKGRSGGARPNTGGARPGAGRPPKPKVLVTGLPEVGTPLRFMLDMMNDSSVPVDLRLRAAATAAPFVHARKTEIGIKDERQSKAEQAAEGLRPAAPPRLVSNG